MRRGSGILSVWEYTVGFFGRSIGSDVRGMVMGSGVLRFGNMGLEFRGPRPKHTEPLAWGHQ